MSTNQAVMANYTDAILALPEEAFLGSLLWFSITRADVHLDTAKQELAAAGLSTETLRHNLRPVDAFKKATNEFAKKFPASNDIRQEVMVRSIGEDGAQAYRHLVLETAVMQAGKKRNLRFEKLGELTHTRGVKVAGEYSGHSVEARRTSAHLAAPLTPEQEKWLQGHVDDFEDRYDHLLNYMDSHAVRTFVREYIYNLGGVLVKESGGLYFVAQEHADEVRALMTWVKSIGSEFHSVDLLNLSEQRDMIMEAFEQDTVKEVERLMGEVGKILSDPDRQVEEKTWDAYAEKAAELRDKITEYNAILGGKAEDAATHVNLFGDQLISLSTRIRESKTMKAKLVNAPAP